MMEPIKTGDRATIIRGALGNKGPNVGKRVIVGTLRGEHSKYGRIWKVHGDDLTSEFGDVNNTVDCAAAWLLKDPPPPVRALTVQKDMAL